MTNASSHSVFRQLLGTRAHREGSVSKAFAACFRDAPSFRTAVLDLLWNTCEVPVRRPTCGWACDSEVVINPESRPDFHIYPLTSSAKPFFRIESKVGARLTKGQLLQYRLKKRGEYLVAITKRRPEIESAWFEQNHVHVLRWQDVHRALTNVSARAVDRYLCDGFVQYLEELEMAHREDIRRADLNRIQVMFGRITAARNTGLGAEDAFRLTADCLAMLDDVKAAALEEEPRLRRFHRWGSNYYNWRDPDTGQKPQHVLVFHFHKNKWRTHCGAGLVFEKGKDPFWQVSGRRVGEVERNLNSSIRSICTKKVLDQGKMLESFLRGIRQLKIVS